MKIDRYIAVLDACVLAPMPVADTLLRLAEEPAFYTPRWSPDIFEELRRTLRKRFRYTEEQVTHRITEMQRAFPEAAVDGYQDMVPAMKNHEKDRHVLAAAVRCGAHAVITDNKKHFPTASLAPYGIECLTADEFLQRQYHLDPDAFINVLVEQARNINWTLARLISQHVPSLAKLIRVKRPAG